MVCIEIRNTRLLTGKTENGIIDIELKKAVGAAEMEISVTKP